MIRESVEFKDKRVVDVGCGDGTYTADLFKTASPKSVLGIDPAAAAIERAGTNYGNVSDALTFKSCLPSDLVDSGETFDIAVYRGVIHHVDDPEKEIAVSLKLADQVVYLEANGSNPVLKLLERVSPYHRRHNERSYLLGTLKKWIRNSGGRPVSASYFGLVPMFCPNWYVPIGAALEPLVRSIPLLRAICCGQLIIVGQSSGNDGTDDQA
jgi:SAM-dependent methyltransferase